MKLLEYYKNEGVLECGIDECGRGAYAGPVVAAAVVWPVEAVSEYDVHIQDSKKLSAKKRREVAEYIKQHALDWSVTFIDNNEIDKVNILNATFQAMHTCIDKLVVPIEHILVDGNGFKPYMVDEGRCIDHTCVVKGDGTYISIAAASIIAKVARDEYMIGQSKKKEYACYGWDTNVGYGTKHHRDAIVAHGLCDMHRRSFAI